MEFLPVNLNIENRLSVVVGGGSVGARKVINLMKYDTKVRVISREFNEKILKHRDKLEIIEGDYKKEHLRDSFLVFICTNNKNLNLKVYEDAKSLNCLVNIVTHPELCDFTIPSVVQRGSLKIAVSTDGKSPALSKIIRKELEEKYNEDFEKIVKIMGKIREKQLTINNSSDINSKLFYDVLNFLKKGNFIGINKKIKEIFGFEIDLDENGN